MKFLISPTRDALERSRPPVRLFLGFSLLLLLASAVQRGAEGELTPAGVLERYLGSGEPSETMPLAALVESLHVSAFVYGFLLLMLGSLLVVSPVSERLRQALTFGAALSCAFDLATPWVVVALRAGASMRVVSFVLAAGFMVASVFVIARAFGRETSE